MGKIVSDHGNETNNIDAENKKRYVDLTKHMPAFEPKLSYRYIVTMSEFPSWCICSIDRPKFIVDYNCCSTNKESFTFEHQLIELELYDPIVPSMAQRVYELVKENKQNLSDIDLKVLGPVGDIVEHWRYEDCTLVGADFGNLAFNKDEEAPSRVVKIKLLIKCKKILLEF